MAGRFNFRALAASGASTNGNCDRSTKRLTITQLEIILNHMVENRLDATFRALADPTRRGMLANLALGDKSVGELGQPFRMSFAGAAKHVKVLESAGLIERRKAGRKQICTLKGEPLAEAEAWLRQWEKFWSTRLDRLQALVEADEDNRR
jgi:DNA-binding transcriptional ArsR family regulator